MIPKFPLGRILAAVGLALMVSAAQASASTIYILDIDHCSGTCGGGPYGEVELTQIDGDTVKVEVTLYPDPTDGFVNSGLHTFTFNILGSPTFDSLTSGFAFNSDPSPYHQDGFGDFLYAIECTSCGSGGSDPNPGPLSFNVNLAGITEASFIGNPTYFFTADIFGGNEGTGAVGADGPVTPVCTDGDCNQETVPEPATLTLLGTGLGMISVRLRRKKA